ncbi:3-hydroxyacyl-CoA dehydrogenase NAD-binding domain-containing protein [Oceanicella sp. SM1341]|uniref:3-hydroxyacyl-CoA dehydrogenase NAD-binding domain-containing protein n=1 Tax=Oceanicella sp. SM1341 TaxID=1548889 RepID=UPI000E4DCCAB|nr:3-hydroxyacyl-CoA dehydrogenase NAD-binding domain-containing protein [Oceanicella sp. SM1341]
MTDFHYLSDDAGIATILWDQPDTAMNVLTFEALEELSTHLERALADDAVKGIVVTSGKKDFAGGMDLRVLGALRAASASAPGKALFEGLMKMHGVLRRLERAGADPKTGKGGKPVAWASPGTAAGIGLEIALACHRRFVADAPRARLGLPEIKVGLFPGAGGTMRVSRMLGLMASAPILLEGKMMKPAEALDFGLIDEVTEPEALLETARAWVLSAKPDELIKPWDRKGWKMPGGAPYTAPGFPTFVGAAAMVHGRTQGVYPAAKALLSAIYEGALVPFDTALRIEARHFVSVILDPSSEAMIRSLFLSKQALEKGALRPEGVADRKVSRLGVIGAGMMGAGIAQVAAAAGIDVVLLDRDAEAAEAGRAGIAKRLEASVDRGRLAPGARDAALARITAGADMGLLAGADLVIEAVFEDPAVKAPVLSAAEGQLGPQATLATNTSTLPVSGLAKASARPENFIGIHFFSPVDRMMLVEIIRGKQTGDAAVARALDFVRQIGKTPIVVNDARFFYANRCIIPYINEGVMLVAEGVNPVLVEHAATGMGMPLGPLQLVDETSIDLAARIARATSAAGEGRPPSAADDVIFTLEGEGRLGRKAKAGFYAYDEAGKRTGLWPGLAGHWPMAPEQPGVEEVRHRLILIQVLEALRALEEGVLTDVRAGDVGAILGWGFMPWSGGPFSWVDMTGPGRVLEMAEELAARCGPRFAPPALLRDMATGERRFYPGATRRDAA